jgi:hypothetical protein
MGEREHEIYADHSICDYPQSGERIAGRQNLQALRSQHPGKPLSMACSMGGTGAISLRLNQRPQSRNRRCRITWAHRPQPAE